MSAARRRACVEHVTKELDVSERFACKVLGQHRSTQRKVPRAADDEAALTESIINCQTTSETPPWAPRKLPPV